MSTIVGSALRSRFDTRFARLGVGVACLMVIAFGFARQYRTYTFPGATITSSDFFSYYQAAQAVRHGVNPFVSVAAWIQSYTAGSPLRASYYVYAPFFALLVVPFTFVPFPLAFALWGVANVAFVIGAVYCLLSVAGMRISRTSVLVFAAAVSLLSTVRLEFNWGQADIFLLFLIAAAFWLRQVRGAGVAGVLLAIACVTKPPLLALLVFLLWKREFKFAVVASVGSLAMLFVPFLWLGGQAFNDQIAIWRFWSTQYVSFIDNQSPKGVLSRLFTVNSNGHPLIVAPALMTTLWLLVCAATVLCAATVVAPSRLRRDPRTLVELGVAVSAVLIISPLTEYIYLTLLVVPLLGLVALLRAGDWRAPRWRMVLLGFVTCCGLLFVPLQRIEYFFWPRMRTPSVLGDLYVILAPAFLYVLVALFGLQLHALHVYTGSTLSGNIRRLLGNVPAVVHDWMGDASHMLAVSGTGALRSGVSPERYVVRSSGGIALSAPVEAEGLAAERIRLLLFTNSVAIGGMEKHVELIARGLDRSTAQVYGVTPQWEAIAPWNASFANAVDQIAHITPDRRYGTRSMLRETVRLWRQLRQWRIQVVHMHLTTHQGGASALLAARLAGIPAVVCTEHLAPETPAPHMRRWWRNILTSNYDQVVCVSLKNRRAREQYLYTPAAKTSVVTNGIDITPFEVVPPSQLAPLRDQLGIPRDAPVVGTVVRFVEEKGLNYLLDALPKVLLAAPTTRLLLVGDGPLRGELEQQASDLGVREQVIFAGFQPDPRPYLSLMNAFVLPVPFGSASIGLLEAMAMRRAAIITFGGEGEAVIDGESGLCPPPRDAATLADAICRVVLDPAYERLLGDNARRRVEAEFSSQHVAAELLALYQRLLARKRTARRS
jgi:glycosyltransferase involved in cell wall biosynthesis